MRISKPAPGRDRKIVPPQDMPDGRNSIAARWHGPTLIGEDRIEGDIRRQLHHAPARAGADRP